MPPSPEGILRPKFAKPTTPMKALKQQMPSPPRLSSRCPTETQPTCTSYVFIDYENLQPSDLDRVTKSFVKFIVIVGEHHSELPIEWFEFAQRHPGQLRVIKTPSPERGSLDVVLSFECGNVLADADTAEVHLLSRDSEYDSLIRHIAAQGHSVHRHTDLNQVPVLQTRSERYEALRAALTDPSDPRPGTRSTLMHHIRRHFEYSHTPTDTEATLKRLVDDRVLSITPDGDVRYLG